DVLLAGRQGQYETAAALGVQGLPAEAPGHLADELLAGGEEADIGAAEVQGVADRLAFGDDDVRPHGAGRFQQAERDGLGDDDDQEGPGRMGGFGDVSDVGGGAEDVGGLDDDTGGLGVDGADHRGLVVDGGLLGDGLDAGHMSGGLNGAGIVRVQAAGEDRLLPASDAGGHHHRLGRARGAV